MPRLFSRPSSSLFNDRFARAPKFTTPAYRPVPDDIDVVLATRTVRKTSNDSLIAFQGQAYRLRTASGHVAAFKPRISVTVLIDGTLRARHNGAFFTLQPFAKPPRLAHTEPLSSFRKPATPAPDHPWR